jgi:hypothetical protein
MVYSLNGISPVKQVIVYKKSGDHLRFFLCPCL